MKPILCLDFDGVIHSYTSRWQGAAVIPDAPVPGALEFIVKALETYEVAIFSSRSHQWGGKRAMKRWLIRNLCELGNPPEGVSVPEWWAKFICDRAGMDPWYVTVEDASTHVVRSIKWPWFKPPAKVTIDDRALTFTGIWPALSEIDGFQPWNKLAPSAPSPTDGERKG